MSAPYFDISTPVPAWGRVITDAYNKTTVQLDGRGGGYIAGITPQTLLPHGETVSILTSAYVKNTLQSTRNGYEGIGHSLKGFVQGPTGSPVKVYDNNILTNGDPGQWINDTWQDYRRVTFIEQMPDNTHPEWVESVWFTKGITGQTNLRSFEFRDHYSRTYNFEVGSAVWTGFSKQTHSNFLRATTATIMIRYLDTIVLRISKGQMINVRISAYLRLLRMYDQAAGSMPFVAGVALKLTRRSDGGSDWWSTNVSTSATSNDVANELVERSYNFESEKAYTQAEIAVWMVPSFSLNSINNVGPIIFDHQGMSVDITATENVTTGSE